jgi:Zn-dependent M28 family amino/carboxypeptidase
LAVTVGPREATSPAYAYAAHWVQSAFERYGYNVARQPLHVPAGNSWGIDVPAGSTWNVVATPPGFDVLQPHRVVGAHLDTVPQAPGAEDDGSGIGVVLELARMAAIEPPKTPVVFVAFAAEEPRGDSDALHHFGSTAYVDRLDAHERAAVKGMAALDRVGVPASAVPVCTGGLGSTRVQRALMRAGDRAGARTERCDNTGADHWSFEKAGIPAARVGGVSYPEYHSAADLPRVVSRAQLARSAAVVWQWITH